VAQAVEEMVNKLARLIQAVAAGEAMVEPIRQKTALQVVPVLSSFVTLQAKH